MSKRQQRDGSKNVPGRPRGVRSPRTESRGGRRTDENQAAAGSSVHTAFSSSGLWDSVLAGEGRASTSYDVLERAHGVNSEQEASGLRTSWHRYAIDSKLGQNRRNSRMYTFTDV